MKRTLALILAAIMILTALVIVPVSADYRSGDWGYTVLSGNATINCYYGEETDVRIPRNIDGYRVTGLSCRFDDDNNIRGIFYKKAVTSVTIPDSVTSIDWNAFAYCTSLTSVTIPNSVTEIGLSAFEDCTSLTRVNIPYSVNTIQRGAFGGCTSLTSIDVDPNNKSYKTVDGNIFTKDGKTLVACPDTKTSVTIPDRVTEIGEGAFEGCRSLTSVSIPSGVKVIGEWAFYECTSLTNVTIPDSIKSIGKWAFSRCESLTSVSIPPSVTSIGERAFACCFSLASVTIPDSVTEIGEEAFDGCSSLTTVNYTGSEKDWYKIEIGDNNKDLLSAKRVYDYAPGGISTTLVLVIVIAVLVCALGVTVGILIGKRGKKVKDREN